MSRHSSILPLWEDILPSIEYIDDEQIPIVQTSFVVNPRKIPNELKDIFHFARLYNLNIITNGKLIVVPTTATISEMEHIVDNVLFPEGFIYPDDYAIIWPNNSWDIDVAYGLDELIHIGDENDYLMTPWLNYTDETVA